MHGFIFSRPYETWFLHQKSIIRRFALNLKKLAALPFKVVKYVFSLFYEIFLQKMPLYEIRDYDEYWLKRENENCPPLYRYRHIGAKLPQAGSVLDVGCGEGRFLKYLKQVRPDLKLYGIDKSEVAISKIKALGIDGNTIDLDNFSDLGLQGRFDNVVVMELIEHLANPEQLLKELKSLNAEVYYVTIPNMGFIVNRLRLALGGKMPVTVIIFHIREHIRFWTCSDFKYWVKTLGFKIIDLHGQNGIPLLWRVWPSLFARQIIYALKIDA